MFLLLVAIAVTTFSRIRITGDHAGLTVRDGFPTRVCPSIASPPSKLSTSLLTEWDAWGYRDNPASWTPPPGSFAPDTYPSRPPARKGLRREHFDNPGTPVQLVNVGSRPPDAAHRMKASGSPPFPHPGIWKLLGSHSSFGGNLL